MHSLNYFFSSIFEIDALEKDMYFYILLSTKMLVIILAPWHFSFYNIKLKPYGSGRQEKVIF